MLTRAKRVEESRESFQLESRNQESSMCQSESSMYQSETYLSSKSQLDVMSSKGQSSNSQLDGRSNKSQSSSNDQLDGMPEKCHSMSAENGGDGDVQSEASDQSVQEVHTLNKQQTFHVN